MRVLCKTEKALASRGLAVREIPTFAGFDHRAYILVEKIFAIPATDVSDPEVPVLSIVATTNRDQACAEFLEWCYQATSTTGRFFGIGSTEDEAVQRARSRAYEELVAVDLKLNLRPHRASRDALVSVEQLNDIDGKLITTAYHDEVAHEIIVAELMLNRAPYYLAAVGCGPSARKRAIYGVFTKLNAFFLRRRRSSEWIKGALSRSSEIDYREALTIGSHATQGELKARVWSDEHALKIASVVIPEGQPCGDVSLAQQVDSIHLGLRAPIHFSLAHGETDVALSRRFHENSKLHVRHRQLPLIKRENMRASVHNTLSMATRDYRFTRLQIALNPRVPENPQSIAKLLSKRRSAAAFAADSPDLQDLAYVLLSAYGVTGKIAHSSKERENGEEFLSMGLRATPSAGGLNSNDIFVLLDQMIGAVPGLFYFNPEQESLQLVNSRARISDLAEMTGYPERVRSSSVVILLAGALSRIQWKYWERGYRMALLDCGHLAQSLIIAATEIDLIAHPIGGFVDDQVNALIGFDGINDTVLHLLVVGKRRQEQGSHNEE